MNLPGTSDAMAEMSLLPTSHLRSDDPEAGNPEAGDSDPGDHDGKPHVHRITGEFADPRLTAEFGPMAFRSMYPLHAAGIGLMCVGSAAFTVVERDIPEAAVTGALGVVLGALGLWARVAVHQWQDTKKAQSFGALAWTIISVAVNLLVLIGLALATEELCSTVDSPAAILAEALEVACFVVVNASHGMEFWHATSLVGVMLVGYIAEAIACGSKLATTLAIGELVLMAAGAHFAQLIARRGFMLSYYIKESRDRLDFRDRMASHREHQDGGAPPPQGVPHEWSTTASSTPTEKWGTRSGFIPCEGV